ncbi:MAG: DNA-formamidopyrimidine glycosylase family protein, partial [Planctomycetota bacterium]
MPELPEVETVARAIRPRLEGRRIEGVNVNW